MYCLWVLKQRHGWVTTDLGLLHELVHLAVQGGPDPAMDRDSSLPIWGNLQDRDSILSLILMHPPTLLTCLYILSVLGQRTLRSSHQGKSFLEPVLHQRY